MAYCTISVVNLDADKEITLELIDYMHVATKVNHIIFSRGYAKECN